MEENLLLLVVCVGTLVCSYCRTEQGYLNMHKQTKLPKTQNQPALNKAKFVIFTKASKNTEIISKTVCK